MALTIITPADLAPFATIDTAKADAMIADAMADASRVAPCIDDDLLAAEKLPQFRSVLRAALLRWHEAGTGALQAQQAGIYGQTLDTRQVRKGMFWPSEIESLQAICKGDEDTSGAYSVDTVGFAGNMGHADICVLNFGGIYCSCGAVLTAGLYPLYEV